MKKGKNKRFCKNGHDTSITGRDKIQRCIACDKITHKKWRDENKEYMKLWHKRHYKNNRKRILEEQKEYVANHKEERAIYVKKYQEDNKEILSNKRRNSHLLKTYGITSEEFDQMLMEQNDVCLGCGGTNAKWKFRKRGLVVDHDHKTGKIRGLLCDNCNFILGAAYDDPKILLHLVNYLHKHSKKRKKITKDILKMLKEK